MKLLILLCKIACFFCAALFLAMIAMANAACPMLRCNGPEGDGWMLPFLFAPIGIPALIGTVVLTAGLIRRQLR